MKTEKQFKEIAKRKAIKVSKMLEKQNIVILTGANDTGKTMLLKEFCKMNTRATKFKSKSTRGSIRRQEILNFSEGHNFCVFDNIDLHLHFDQQKALLCDILLNRFNCALKILLTTHAPAIAMEGWFPQIINIEDL